MTANRVLVLLGIACYIASGALFSAALGWRPALLCAVAVVLWSIGRALVGEALAPAHREGTRR
jgi:hypothetical protein